MRRLTTQDFIDKAMEVHGTTYDYRHVDYINNKLKVKIVCPYHGMFAQSPVNHLRWGCYSCRLRKQLGDKLHSPSNLYYLSFKYNGHTYYKIGITHMDVARRYKNQQFQDFTILAVVSYKTAGEAFDREQYLLNLFYDNRRAVPKEIYGDGWTETLNTNIFNTLDKQQLIEKLKGC